MNDKSKSKLVQEISLWIPVLVVSGIVFTSGFFIGRNVTNKYNNNIGINNLNGILNNRNKHIDEGVDFSLIKETWEVLNQKFLSTNSESNITKEDIIYGAIEGMVNSVGDPYTTFLRPETQKQFAESLSGNFSGVGMEVGMRDDGITVIAPLRDTPAEKAGILSGDKIIKIDGESTSNMDLNTAVNKIRGERGTAVTITVSRGDNNENLDIEIVRDIINIPTLEYELLDNGVFKISLYNFGNESSAQFRNALRSFVSSGSNNLLLDLRGNPGGFLESAVDIASLFLPTGKVIVQEDFGNDNVKILRSRGQSGLNNLNMVILVNGGSASASEILAGALQEHSVATIVGTQTFGKGSVQELVNINSETSLKVTIARWLTPNGLSISENGLTPDIVVDEVSENARGENWDELSDFEKIIRLFEYQEETAIRILTN